LGYLLSAVLLFPMILSIAELAKLHPVAGGLYAYSKEYLNPFSGFLSGWCYFVGKTTTVAILMHKIVQFFQSIIPYISNINTLVLDYTLIFFLVFINVMGVRVGGKIQYFFTVLKSIPVIFVFIMGACYFSPNSFVLYNEHMCGLVTTIPITVFALLGFDIICAIGHLIEDSSRNIKKVIITSFVLVTCIAMLFQFLIFGVLGLSLASMEAPILGFSSVLPISLSILARFANGVVFAAFIAGGFSILTSNCWNLHTLANNNHVPLRSFFTKVTRNNIPWVSLICEGVLGCIILAICYDQVVMQNMSVFAQGISFLLSTIAACVAAKKFSEFKLKFWVPVLGVGTCGYILYLALSKIMTAGVSFSFLSIIIFGICTAIVSKYFNN
jgi:amino acid transporter